jgi:class 3 adenylate cyclase
MRCPHCRHETRERARFCGACGASLESSVTCPRCGAINPRGQSFCDACGESLSSAGGASERDARAYTPRYLVERILTTRSALEGERKQVSVLFADVVDSMRLAERLGAEEWHRVLDRVFEILSAGIHRFEGTINQFTGDGVMALFGAPLAHEDHAQRACHAALSAMNDLHAYAGALRARGLELSVRMGINSGEVVVGKIGDDLRMDYTAQGHCVGLAARMEQLAAPGTVLLTESTAQLVEGFFALADVGPRSMKGVSAEIRTFELRGIGPRRTRLDGSALRGLSRLIGRETELTWLDGILARSIASNGQVVGVIGEAGVGKSRLCLEFIQRCRARGVPVHEVHCPSHGATVPWLAIRELMRGYFGLAPDTSADSIRRTVEQQLLALDAGFASSVPLVLEILGIGDSGQRPERATPQAATFMRRFFRLQSMSRPGVVFLDDAHWIDRASDELVQVIAASVRGTQTLLLANFRPEYRPAWIGGSHYHQLALSPLGEEASRELLRDLLGSDGSLDELSARILERTGGSPFFTEEVVTALAASGSLLGERGAYRLATPIETVALPATVQALLTARIDRLGERAKDLLQVAAVIGKQFDEPVLREVSGLGDGQDFDDALGVLQDEEFFRLVTLSPKPEYTFKHPLVCEVAYLSQLGERRAQVHAAVATALEKLRSDRLGEYASLIAHHWEASGMRFEAARWKRRAALRVANIKVGIRGVQRRRARPPENG